MRKLFYFFSILLISNFLSAQLPNPNFETWNTTSTNNLDTWSTQGKVTQVTGAQAGTYAVTLETSFIALTPTAAILALTNGVTDGYPYTQKTDTIKIWVKYNVANGDTAIIHIEQSDISKNYVRAGAYILSAGSATSWTEIAIPMDPYDTTLTPAFISVGMSNTLDYAAQISSYLTVDNIRCYYKGALQTNLPNNSYENWTTQSRADVAGWTTSNELLAQFGIDSINCEQTTTAQNGTYAIKLRTIDLFGLFLVPGGIVTGIDQFDAAQDPANYPTIAVNQRYASLSGYLKFTKKATDEGEASVYMFKNGAMVGEGHYYQSATVSSYTQFEAKIIYKGTFTGIPDSATIVFLTSKDPQNATGACVLWVDNIQLNITGLGVKQNTVLKNAVYPNPFTNEIKVETLSENAIARITSMDGKEILSQKLNRGDNTIVTSTFANGIYLLRISDGENITTQKIVKQ